MSALNLLTSILWIYTHSPVYLIDEFINGLQMTPNPDSYLTPLQIFTKYGYPAETHTVLTSDGYLLQVDRIPQDEMQEGHENKYPILLIHGLPDTSEGWIVNGPNRSLAYLLADRNYDVWMINTRGTTFSTSHVKYTPMEKEFWDFSIYEVGIYDLPATIDFILEKTNSKQVFCISYSAGNPEFYIMLSVLPQYNKKVVAQIGLAPMMTMPQQFTSISSVFSLAQNALEYLNLNTRGGFVQHDLLTKILLRVMNSIHFFGRSLYEILLKNLYGEQKNHINDETLAIFYNNWPAGGSVKELIHFLQMFKSFAYFDYGEEENLKTYGTPQPPEYNISNIRVPIRAYYANSDLVATPLDVMTLYEKLPMKAGLVEISDPTFSHLDFMSDKNLNELLNNDILNAIPYMMFNNSSNMKVLQEGPI